MGISTHVPPNFATRLGVLLGIPMGSGAWTALVPAWTLAEGSSAEWNPFDTEYELPGATLYNSAGVKNYPHPVAGICATALTIINGDYNGILGDLQGGKKTAAQIVQDNRVEFNTWGTNPDTILELLAHPQT